MMEILIIRNSRNPNVSFQIQVLRSWGWDLGLGNAGRTVTSTIVASIVYGYSQWSCWSTLALPVFSDFSSVCWSWFKVERVVLVEGSFVRVPWLLNVWRRVWRSYDCYQVAFSNFVFENLQFWLWSGFSWTTQLGNRSSHILGSGL